MSPEVWQRVNRIFGDALEVPPEVRPGFIRNAADGDPAVEAEVLRLLEALHSTGGFLQTPAVDLNGILPPPSPHAGPLLTPGVLLCKRFEITRFLASGGMGEVYEAWDNVLREAVALKTIRPHIAQRAEIIERFRQEVRNARALSHPNICRVHELFSDEIETGADTGSHPAPPITHPGQKTWFLSMELLRGITLLECIRQKGKLPPNHALDFARQLALGLEAAHTHGLVHRDFKSANVMLMENGTGPARAVIMDFGLSIRTLKDPNQPTEHSAAGGTPGYMAPEQATGGEVGPLADQYAFGVVLCEMLTGQLPRTKPGAAASGKQRMQLPRTRPGAATSGKQRMQLPRTKPGAAVSGRQRMQLPAHHLPPRCEHVLRRCLERDPLCRFPDVKTAARALLPPGLLGTPWRIAAALLFVTALAGGLWKYREYRNRCLICDVVQLTPDTDQSESPSLSRDGKTIAYSSDRAESGNLDIFVQHLPNGQPIRLTTNQSRDSDPSISADGSMVAFRSERDGGGIYLVGARGGSETLLVAQGRNPQISPDGKTVAFWTGDRDPAVASGKLYWVAVSGGEPTQIALTFKDARYPMWSPGGDAILFTGCQTATNKLPGCSDWWVTDRGGTRLVQTRSMQMLQKADVQLSRPASGFWSNNEVLFSGKNGLQQNLWSIGLDPQTWQAAATPTRLLRENARDLGPYAAVEGTIAYTRSSGALHIWRMYAKSNQDQPELTKITDDTDVDSTPYIAEGERYLAFARGRGTNTFVIVREVQNGVETSLENITGHVFSPIIDRTGEWLGYARDEAGVTSVYAGQRRGAIKQLCTGCGHPTGWYDTNKQLFFRGGVPSEIWLGDPRTGSTQVLVTKTGSSLDDASWSPANEMMMFTETRNDRKRIYAVRFRRDSRKVEGNWLELPSRSGTLDHPRWSENGKTVFYVSDRDGFLCVYGQQFAVKSNSFVGEPFAIAHFHHVRASINNVSPRSFNLSVGGKMIYLNLGEQSSTVQVGRRSERR